MKILRERSQQKGKEDLLETERRGRKLDLQYWWTTDFLKLIALQKALILINDTKLNA